MRLLDEDEKWRGCLEGETAYDKLLGLRQKHLIKVRVCRTSKRWWSDRIAKQLAVVRDHCRRHGENGELIRDRYRLRNLIQEGKRKYWEAFCTESDKKSPYKVVQWARDPWRLKKRMGCLRSAGGFWLELEGTRWTGWCWICSGVMQSEMPCWLRWRQTAPKVRRR